MKRHLFSELKEGFQALQDEQNRKITLKKHVIEQPVTPQLTSDELVELRQTLNLSQSVFAHYLRINKRTLENWEQGRTKPNAQAATLIKMVQQYPDTIERLNHL